MLLALAIAAVSLVATVMIVGWTRDRIRFAREMGRLEALDEALGDTWGDALTELENETLDRSRSLSQQCGVWKNYRNN